jgi:hypothetical protein
MLRLSSSLIGCSYPVAQSVKCRPPGRAGAQQQASRSTQVCSRSALGLLGHPPVLNTSHRRSSVSTGYSSPLRVAALRRVRAIGSCTSQATGCHAMHHQHQCGAPQLAQHSSSTAADRPVPHAAAACCGLPAAGPTDTPLSSSLWATGTGRRH